jgi:adhesin/invasin
MTVSSGPGALTGTMTALTNASGSASFGNLVLNTPGSYMLVAKDGAINSAASGPFLVSAAVGIATHLVFLLQPTNTQTHGALAPVTVEVEDANNLVVTTDNSFVTIAVNFGTTTLQTLSVQAVAGVATFSGLSIGSSKSYTLEATDGSLTPAQSNGFTVAPGPVANLSFQQQPAAVTSGSAISPTVTVIAMDNLGNFIANELVTVTVSSGPGALRGTMTAITNASGSASFSNLVLDTPGSYMLVAKDGSVVSAASSPFLVSAAIGIATHLAFVQQPANTQTHGALAPVTVAVEDANNLVVTTDNSFVTIAVNFGATTLQTLSAQAVNGVATFNGLSIGSSKSYTLEATDGSLTPAQSDGFTVAPGPVASLSFQQQPGAVNFGNAISPAVTVQATDSLGNLIANAPITVSIASGPGALAGTVTAMTNAVGIATFPSLVLITPGNYMLVAKDGAVSSAVSSPFTVKSVLPALRATFTGTIPSTAIPGTVILPALQIADAAYAGNVINGAESTVYYLAVTPTLFGIISPPLATNKYTLNLSAGGTHTESQGLTIPAVGSSGTYYIIAQIDSGGIINLADTANFVASGPISISASANPSHSTVTVNPTTVASGATTTITFQAEDTSGNKLTTGGSTVTFALSGTGTSSGTIGAVTDNHNGTYTAIFTATTAGTARAISATVNGTAVTTAKPSVTVTPGAVSAGHSTVTISPTTLPPGSTATITFQAKDAAGNNLTIGGSTVTFTLSGAGTANGTIGAVTDHHNGTYTATFTATTVGTARAISATINGSAVTTTKPAVTVTAGNA